MNFTTSEQYVLSSIVAGILQAGEMEGIISKSQWVSFVSQACSELGTSMDSILSRDITVDHFAILRKMDSQKKDFTQSFLYRWYEKVSSSERATFYLVSTLEQGNCLTNV